MVAPVTNDFSQFGRAAGTQTANEAGAADRFLTLLVAQLQNQDPLSPMDNAQVTSQMAQIQTVTGVEKLNTSIGALSMQFVQMQAVQGASLIGKDVIVPGNKLDFADGVAQGGFELASAADAVKVEILSPAGQVVETLNLGKQSAGMHSFDWKSGAADASSGLTFRVSATSGSTALTSTALMRDTVTAVRTAGDQLVLDLSKSGGVAYGDIKAFN